MDAMMLNEKWTLETPEEHLIFLKHELETKTRELDWARDYQARLEDRIVELHKVIARLTEEYKLLLDK
jgi:hypothetical protein